MILQYSDLVRCPVDCSGLSPLTDGLPFPSIHPSTIYLSIYPSFSVISRLLSLNTNDPFSSLLYLLLSSRLRSSSFMSPPSRRSRLTSQPVPEFFVHADSRHFKDTSGRTLILRGVNLCGSAKVPRGHPQHVLEDFWESAEQDGLRSSSAPPLHIDPSKSTDSSLDSSGSLYRQARSPPGISYVGQTLDLEDGSADIHLTRLRQWGFNVVRFVTVWEALEHQGPLVPSHCYRICFGPPPINPVFLFDITTGASMIMFTWTMSSQCSGSVKSTVSESIWIPIRTL